VTRSEYGSIAEFYDLVALQQSASTGPALARMLRLLPENHGPVVEIGAGTGRVTRTILAARTDLRVIAVEPSAEMRAVLTSRLWAEKDARDRVTIVAAAAPDLDLPPQISAAVIFGVAGHLDETARRRMFSDLRARLAPGGFIAVELMGAVRDLRPTRTLSADVGEQTYEWWVSGRPLAADEMHFSNTWRVLHRGRIVREVVDEHRWVVLTPERVAEEAGMRLREQLDPTDGARVVILERG
jgi:SAM-dependent methyltransferase